MRFEIFDKDKKRVFYTNDVSAISDEDTLKALRKTGHKFKINRQSVSLGDIRALRG